MKIYLAAMFGWKDQIKAYAEELRSLGIEVTSRWLDEKKPSNVTLDQCSDEYLENTAGIDIVDVVAGDDGLVLFTTDPKTPTPRGGRHFESGFAYAFVWLRKMLTTFELGPKRLIIVGPRENIFHYRKDVIVVPDFEALKKLLIELSAN